MTNKKRKDSELNQNDKTVIMNNFLDIYFAHSRA